MNEQYNELVHYGVLGMKWGVHRAKGKAKQNNRLNKTALNYDVKAARLAKKAERRHSVSDLGKSNKYAQKANNYKIKAAKLQKRALTTTDELKRSVLESRAARLDYKSSKKQIDADRLSKNKGYGIKAMKLSVKSDKMAKRAAKARMLIARNERYQAAMKRKISEISQEDLRGAYSFVKSLYD